MDPQPSDDPVSSIKETRLQIESRLSSLRSEQHDLISSLQTLVPDLVSSLNLSLDFISTLNHRPFTPLSPPPVPIPNPNPNPNPNKRRPHLKPPPLRSNRPKTGSEVPENPRIGGEGELSVVRRIVAAVLIERVPFSPIESSTILRKLENDVAVLPAEKSALRGVAGVSEIAAVEMALRAMEKDNVGVELENFDVGGKSRVLVMSIDRNRLIKELPESSQQQFSLVESGSGNASPFPRGGPSPRLPMMEMWTPGQHMSGMPPMFPGTPGPMRGMVMMGRGMGIPPQHRPPFAQNVVALPGKGNSDEDLMKDVEVLLNKKSFKELQKSKTGEELLNLITRATAKEIAAAAKFKTKGGSQLQEYCSALTKEDCRQKARSYISCAKVHFRRIIAPHTDINLGDCSFLDTCRHMKTCKYVHYELDPTSDMMGAPNPSRPLKAQRAEYCSQVELGESQWINCDIRNFRMDILGQFGVIMADPPWDIHMELPYGTMADDEMRTLNVPALQTDGLIFLWVTGRAMELGRECLELWGYKRVEEIIWVKTNQLQRIIRTGRTGHWLNHSKEHCLVGIKGSPLVNRNIDTDVLVAEVRETSRKPDEMYPLLERISPRTRKLELFARMHNTHSGWLSLGNQLSGARLVDEGLRARFRAAYPDEEIQPPSPPRSSAVEVDPTKTPSVDETKPTQFSQPPTPHEKPVSSSQDAEMAG